MTQSRTRPLLSTGLAILSAWLMLGVPSVATAENALEAAPDLETATATPEEELARAFTQLKSEDEATWRQAQITIEKLWSRSGSASMDLLLERGRQAMAREEIDKALEHFTDLVRLSPGFAEGWNARATAHFVNGDMGAAMADIIETLSLEPRHFGALTGLGTILEQIGDERNAIKAFRDALALHPHLEGPQEAVKRLAPSADGRDA